MRDEVQFARQSREDFRDAAARHRRTAWRVTAACAIAYAVLALVVAVGLSPLLWGLIGVMLDAVNHIVPTPDVIHYASQQLDSQALARASVAHRLWLLGVAALPGIVVLTIAARMLRRALMRSPLFDPAQTVGRPANPDSLVEIQLVHTVEEMAIAADVPAPRVIFLDDSVNGAAFGIDAQHATIMIGTQMTTTLTRSQMQAVAAHFVASIADGDMAIGLRTTCTVGLFSLIQRLGLDVLSSIENRDKFRASVRLVRALLIPSAASTALILRELSDPFAAAQRHANVTTAEQQRMTWREWVLMPALGPVFFNGMIAGIINSMALSPLVNLAWRRRKYIADATAVRLTRDPHALDGALAATGATGASIQMPRWAAHLCLLDPRAAGGGDFLSTSRVAIFPSAADRHQALLRMGSSARDVPGVHADDPLPVRIGKLLIHSLFFVVMTFAVGAAGCAYMFSLIATLFPLGFLHMILR